MGEIKKVQIRNGFSDRNNIDKLNETIQIDSFDERTRIQLYNCFTYIIADNCYDQSFYCDVLNDVYCEVINGYDMCSTFFCKEKCEEYIKNTFLHDSYDAVLSLVEYLANKIDSEIPQYKRQYICNNDGTVKWIHFQEEINKLFEKECVGFRFIGDKIVAITDRCEKDEIEQACNAPYNGCKAHIEKAVGFLADREHKDYKNCIKESISAVESVCKIIVGDEKATLGEAIKKLKEKGIKFHQALEKSFSMLFGYTSDEGGIRHAKGLFVSEVSFEEAKFMLVSCSAFVNYLIAEYGKIKKD